MPFGTRPVTKKIIPYSAHKDSQYYWMHTLFSPSLRWIKFCRLKLRIAFTLLPPANEVCEGYVFTGVCLSTLGGGGLCMVILGGMHGFIQGGMHGFIWGGVCGFIRGVHGFSGGCAWFFRGGMHGFSRGGVHGFSSFFGYNEIRSMSRWYPSYWNAFLFQSLLWKKQITHSNIVVPKKLSHNNFNSCHNMISYLKIY